MKKLFLFALILLISAASLGCVNGGNEVPEKGGHQVGADDEAAVAGLVESFGSKLQAVSLQAPNDLVNESIRENYSDFVSPELLAKWLSDPQNAPGRMRSSPWPDHIEVLSMKELPDFAYEVKGEIVEMTSTGVAARRPVTLVVEKTVNSWLIGAVTIGAYDDNNTIVYRNTEYGFDFSLPEGWKGYSVLTGTWEGSAVEGPQSGRIVETGPMLSIRHPQWTAQNQRQDIPIMIFTLDQWNSLQQGEFHIGAAPIGPKELGRNTGYVFALPARYNYAFPPGYEEVENILEDNPLQVD